MELRPNQRGTTTKLSWNYALTTYKSCFTNQECISHAYQTHANIYNPPSFIFHAKIIPNSSY